MAQITTPKRPELLQQIPLGAFLNSGATSYLSAGAGYHISFDANSNDEIVAQVGLHNDYAGEDLKIQLCWQLFSTSPSPGDDVIFEVDYSFLKCDGTEDGITTVTGNNSDTIDVSSRTANRLYKDTLTVLSGVVGSHVLNLTIRRKSSGAGSDSYSSAADFFAVKLFRV